MRRRRPLSPPRVYRLLVFVGLLDPKRHQLAYLRPILGGVIRAIASVAPPTTVGSCSLLAVLVLEGDEQPASEAGAQTLQAGVVSLYGIVVVTGLRYSVGVHSH